MIKFLFLLLPFTRVGSGDSFDVGTWESGDNPGAGSQDFTVFTDTGLNGNFKRIWRAIKNLLNSDGTIQNDKLTGANLIPATTADGSTIEFNNATGAKTLRIKDLGVTTAKINAAAVGTAQLATDSVDNTILKDDASVDANRAVTTNHIRDASVTAAKQAHDITSRKILLVFAQKVLSSSTYGWVGDVQFTANLGVRMPRPGSITFMMGKGSAGAEAAATSATFGTWTFAINDYVGIEYTAAGTNIAVTKNGSFTGLQIAVSGFTAPVLVTIDIEFDN